MVKAMLEVLVLKKDMASSVDLVVRAYRPKRRCQSTSRPFIDSNAARSSTRSGSCSGSFGVIVGVVAGIFWLLCN